MPVVMPSAFFVGGIEMREGSHIFYVIKFRLESCTPWGRPDDLLCSYKPSGSWASLNPDHFGKGLDPWHGKGNDYRPKNKKAHADYHSVWEHTGFHGWWNFKYAEAACKRLEKLSDAGYFDVVDRMSGELLQRKRYQFTIAQIRLFYEVRYSWGGVDTGEDGYE